MNITTTTLIVSTIVQKNDIHALLLALSIEMVGTMLCSTYSEVVMVIDHIGEMRDMKNDLVSRQAAIDIAYKYRADIIAEEIEDLPSVQSEQAKMIKEIRKWINSGNRGSADYFIVDKIEEIINKYEK